MKKKINWKKRISYWFDNVMAKGTISLVILLFGITALVVVLVGFVTALLDGQSGFAVGSSIWVSLMHAIDAGTLAGDSGSLPFIALMSMVTICGLFITSMLIGIINTGLESKMESLRKGKSQVLESSHVVILGFNEGTFTILSELINANENQKKAVIVLMDPIAKDEMESAIAQRIPDTKTTTIICRSGEYAHFSDLEICSLDTCRTIIIDAPDDFLTIKAILAATCLLKTAQNTSAYITALIQEEGNIHAAQIAGEGYAEILYLKNTIARIMAHTCRQPGLSAVFTELFNYGGDEIYIESIPNATGKSIRDLCLHFSRSCILGIQKNGQTLLNPPSNTIVEKEDKLILLAADDGISIPSAVPAAMNQKQFSKNIAKKHFNHQDTLILGCNEMLTDILLEDDTYMPPDTHFQVACSPDAMNAEYFPPADALQNIQLITSVCDIYDQNILDSLVTTQTKNILIISDPDEDADASDAKTLLLLLQLRHIIQTRHLAVSVISEMRRVENQELAQVTGVNDFVISSNITSLMLTQISQTRMLKDIFEELLTSEGSEIYMKPAERYILLDEPVSLFTVSSSAAALDELFIGYRKQTKDGGYELIINPDKNQDIIFSQDDCLVVIAKD